MRFHCANGQVVLRSCATQREHCLEAVPSPRAEAQPEWGRRGHGSPRKNLLRFFAGVLYQSQMLENKRKEQSTYAVSCSLTDQGLTWLFAMGCETIRLKHATLLAKIPINGDNTSWGVAWMKCKGAAFLQRSTNSDETFLRGLFAWSIVEPNRNILGQDMVNPKRTMQWSVMQQRNVSHSTVGIVASGYAKPGRRNSILKCTASHCQRSTQTLLILYLLQFQRANIKNH